MLALEFARWWYGAGFRRLFDATLGRIRQVALAFSLPILVRTLFSPWRRIVTTGSGSISAHVEAMVDNLISRLVGGCVRLLVILFALGAMAALAVAGAALLLVWPFVPAIGVALIVRGFI